MAEWFSKAGFKSNPLDYDPFLSSSPLLGFDEDSKELLYRVSSGSMVLVEGPAGSGKTSLLKAVVDSFRGSYKLVYLDSSRISRQLNISELLTSYYGFIRGRLLKKKPKNMILLLDNVHHLSRRNCERLKFYFDQDYLHSVVFAAANYDDTDFSESLVDRISDTITLKPMDADSAVKVIQSRLNSKILAEPVIRALWVRSQSMRHFMLACEALCSIVVDEGRLQADMGDLAKVEVYDVYEDISSFRCPNCGDRLIRVGDSWRCENCEQFCLSCGSLAADKDEYCPGCGLRFEA